MKRRLLGVAALAAVMGLTTATASGFGKKRSDCGSPCGMTGSAYAGTYGGYGAAPYCNSG
jgi:hypothetical protein